MDLGQVLEKQGDVVYEYSLLLAEIGVAELRKYQSRDLVQFFVNQKYGRDC